jgi:hypothetical protein
MRALAISLATVFTLGFALSAASPAEARTVKKVIIKTGHHHHARHHGRHWRHAHVKKVFIIKNRRHHY